MKYLELKPAEIEVPKGMYIGEYSLWEHLDSGCYLVNDGLADCIAFVSIQNRLVNIYTLPSNCIIDTKPEIVDELIDELNGISNHIITINRSLSALVSNKMQQSAASGLDGDAIMKLLAVAQKPELAKDL